MHDERRPKSLIMSNEKFQESRLAHHYLDGLQGLEIGAAAHNPFGLQTKNVDIADEFNTSVYKKHEIDVVGEMAHIDIVAPGDSIPVPNESQDFVLSSHVLEHFSDPIKALKEWHRVVKQGGYIFMIVPHKERMFDRDKQRTTFDELLSRHEGKIQATPDSKTGHFSFWITGDILDVVQNIGLDWSIVDFQDVDDKVGNGFTVVLKKGDVPDDMRRNMRKKIESLNEKKRAQDESIFRPETTLGRMRSFIINASHALKRGGPKALVLRIKEFVLDLLKK